MTAPTHTLGAVATVLTVATVTQSEKITMISTVMSGTAAIIGCLWPDIDKPGSKISNCNVFLKILSWIIYLIFHHRTITHCLIAIAILGFLSIIVHVGLPEIDTWNFSFFIGYASHIFLDMLTIKGVPLLYPFSKKSFSIGRIRSRGISEFFFFLALLVYTIGIAYLKFVIL